MDAGYGFAVRSEVGKQFMLWLDTDDNGANFFRVPIAPTCALNLYLLAADLWHSSNGMPAYLRRVLLTRWVGEAVRIINADTERMRRMFERTGCAPHHSTPRARGQRGCKHARLLRSDASRFPAHECHAG